MMTRFLPGYFFALDRITLVSIFSLRSSCRSAAELGENWENVTKRVYLSSNQLRDSLVKTLDKCISIG